MAIDFSQVKTITIPEGLVKKITDSQGNILWSKDKLEWHTVWSGSISKTVSNSAGAGDDVDIWTNNVSGTATFRFTFTMSASDSISWSKISYYNGSSTATTTKPSSPTRQNITYDTDKSYILGISNYYSGRESAVTLNYSGSNHIFYLRGSRGTSGFNGMASLTITKIEQYY